MSGGVLGALPQFTPLEAFAVFIVYLAVGVVVELVLSKVTDFGPSARGAVFWPLTPVAAAFVAVFGLLFLRGIESRTEVEE